MGIICFGWEVTFRKNMVIMIAEENTAGMILINMQKYTSAFHSPDMLKAGYIDLRNIMKFHPTDTLIRPVTRPYRIADMGMSIKVQFHILRQGHDIFEQLRRSASARKGIMGCSDNRAAVPFHFIFNFLQ